MSLVVHELLIGTGGGGSNASSLQASPSNPVPIASVTVAHSNSAVHVAHIQQSRVVTITSSQSRLSPSEKCSRLADALAGNPPYSYVGSPQRFSRSHHPSRNVISHIVSGTGISSGHCDGIKSVKTTSSRPTYILPFVLQDHNYGAPPPPTPPHSPPPPPPPPSVSSSMPYAYKVHQIFTPTTTTTTTNARIHSNNLSPTKIQNQYAKIVSEQQSVLTLNNAGPVQITNSSGSLVETSSTHAVTSHIMAAMPLHRQQFMPQPKPLLYTTPSIPVTTVCETLAPQSVSVPCNGGQDTDEESRLSDRSSSVGPSGEETETAPEGEGEEQIPDDITRCICNFTHDDGYMIQCDRCFVWQHVDCMEIDRNNIPDEYLCEACKPRATDKSKARVLQIRRRQEIRAHLARVSSSDSEDNIVPPVRSKNSSSGKPQERKVLKKKKPKTSKENKNNRKHTSSSSSKCSILSSSSNNVKSDHSADDKETKPSLIKPRRRHSTLSGSSHGGGDEGSNNSTFSLEQLRSWIEDYEVAVTNHYSQELRAKVHAARINGISAEFRESTQGAMLGHRCRVAPSYDAGPDSFEDKILVAATRLQIGTAIIEYQGKYTLKAQWNQIQIPPGLPYLPFVLQYNMQKEGLHVCVDARTYGNDARFARRSSQYNAEIRHVVERGSVHLYIVACKEIEEEEEIILPLETAICQQSVPNKSSGNSSSNSSCSSNNNNNSNNNIINSNNNINNTNNSNNINNNNNNSNSSNNAQSTLVQVDGNDNAAKEISKVAPNTSQIRKNGVLQNKKSIRKPLLSLSLPQPLSRVSRRTTSGDTYICEDAVSSPPQITSPMKQRRASGCAGNRSPAKCILKSPIKSPTKTPIDDSSSGESPHHDSPGSGEKMDGHKMTREERKIAAYMKAFERMEKAAQRRQEMEKRKVEDKGKRHHHSHDDDDDDEERSKTAEEGNKGTERDGRKSKRTTRGSPNKMSSNEFSEEENCTSSSEGERTKPSNNVLQTLGSPPSSGTNSVGFRFPKTKKSLMNEWLNETVDPVLHTSPLGGEIVTGVPTCYMRSPSTPARRGGATASSSLVTGGDAEMAGRSAKKRWLRQAIIDETEPQSVGLSSSSSPNSRPDSPNGGIGGDYITPLKKRRLARESMSSEQSNTPPSTPVHSGLDDKYNEEMELDHASDDNFDGDEEKESVKLEGANPGSQIKKEELLDDDSKYNTMADQLTINISKINCAIKVEAKEESVPQELKVKNEKIYGKLEDDLHDSKADSIKVNADDLELAPSHESTNLCERNLIDSIKKEMAVDEKLEKVKKTVKSPKVRKKSHKILKYKNFDKNRNMQRKKKVIKKSSKIKKKTKMKSKKKIKSETSVCKDKKEKSSDVKKITKDNCRTTEKKSDANKSCHQTILDTNISCEASADSKGPSEMTKTIDNIQMSELLTQKPSNELQNSNSTEAHYSKTSETFTELNEEVERPKLPEEVDQIEIAKDNEELLQETPSQICEELSDVKIVSDEHVSKHPEEIGDSKSIDEAPSPKSTEPRSSKIVEDNTPEMPEAASDSKGLDGANQELLVKTDTNSNYFNPTDSKISLTDEDKNFAVPENCKDAELTSQISILKEDTECDFAYGTAPVKQDVKEDSKFEDGPPIPPCTKPAPVKRKLSILEYRKRKSISCERDPKEDLGQRSINTSLSLEFSDASLSAIGSFDNSKNGPQITEPRIAIEESQTKGLMYPSSPQAHSPSLKQEKIKCDSNESENVKWNAAPTLLEQQRENLTARLRREFGLCLPEDSQFKLKLGDFSNKKWAELEKKYQFPGKKLPSSMTINSTRNASLCGARATPTSPVGVKGQQACSTTALPLSMLPLPFTFEKLNDARLPPAESNPRVLGGAGSGSPLLLERPQNDFQPPFAQCKMEGKKSTT